MHIRTASKRPRGTYSVLPRELLCFAMFVFLSFSGHAATPSQRCTDSFLNGEPLDLETCRPAPVSPADKNLVMRSLPTKGEVRRLSKSERKKLDELKPVLRLHKRDRAYDIKVISVPQAWTGLHERAVLLISRPALGLLSSEELQALAAHEIGHEYLWDSYLVAQRQNDTKRLCDLELACDAIAVLTLEGLRVSTDNLTAGLEKVHQFNFQRFGWASNESSYPTAAARRRLVKVMSSRKDGDPKLGFQLVVTKDLQ